MGQIKRIPYTTTPITVPGSAGSGQRVAIPLQPFEAAFGDFQNPVIDYLQLGISAVVTTATTGLSWIDQTKLAANIFLADAMGPRFDLRGVDLWQVGNIEWGDAHFATATTGVGAAQTITVTLRLPCRLPDMAADGHDTAMPLADLLRGGQMFVTPASPALFINDTQTATITTNPTFTVSAYIYEDSRPTLHSRLCYLTQVISALDTPNITIGGALRYAFIQSVSGVTLGLITQSSLTALTSPQLRYASLASAVARDKYLAESRGINALDAIAAGTAYPVWTADHDQSIVDMPIIDLLRTQFTGTLATGTNNLVYSIITDRDPAMSARTMGIPPAQLSQALAAQGRIDPKDGRAKLVSEVDPSYARKLPQRFSKH